MSELSLKTRTLNAARSLLKNRPCESILYRLTKGLHANDLAARIPANYYQYKHGSFRTVVRQGSRFRLDLSEYMQWLIYFGIKDSARDKLYGLVKPGMTIFDIGANIGETTLAFSKLTGPGGKVYAFEPDAEIFSRLQEHIELNGCTNVTAINAAAGDKSGRFFLSRNKNNSGGNHLSSSGDITVDVVTLDEFAQKEKIEGIDLVKADVEGFEMNVFKGASGILSAFKPAIFTEVCDTFLRRAGSSEEELLSFLDDRGYTTASAIEDKGPGSAHYDIIATR